MLVPVHHTDQSLDVHPAFVVGDTWTTEVVPRLPAALAAQARPLKAFQRVRCVATPADLLRAVLAYVVGALSTRRLGAWAVLIGLADISETAWRKRLRASNAWLLWLLAPSWRRPAHHRDPLGPAPVGSAGSMPRLSGIRVGRATTGASMSPTTSPPAAWTRSW
jgi:hypothetical protein